MNIKYLKKIRKRYRIVEMNNGDFSIQSRKKYCWVDFGFEPTLQKAKYTRIVLIKDKISEIRGRRANPYGIKKIHKF